jgi:hypothetical protein
MLIFWIAGRLEFQTISGSPEAGFSGYFTMTGWRLQRLGRYSRSRYGAEPL